MANERLINIENRGISLTDKAIIVQMFLIPSIRILWKVELKPLHAEQNNDMNF